MSSQGTYSPTLGWYIYAPLSVFPFEPTVLTVGVDLVGGPQGPYEWWYLSTTPDTAGIFAYGVGVGPHSDNILRLYFMGTVDGVFDSPYLVVYTPYSSYLAALHLPTSVPVAKDVRLYLLFMLQNTPLN